jgi:oligopeptide transport system ATP-binding protein
MIAMSLLCNPNIIIADEPTTALDVTVQAQILELFKEIKKEFQTSLILITHNMGIVDQISDKTLVLYAGRVMEYGLTKDIFMHPSHPYTRGLIEAIPRIDIEYESLKTIPGDPPNMFERPEGCVFRSRCQKPTHDCKEGNIPMGLIEVNPGHWVDQCCNNCG